MPDFNMKKPVTPKAPTSLKGFVEPDSFPSMEASLEEDKSKDQEPKKKFDKERLLRIFDEILFNEEYSEEFKIKGRLSIVLRSRSTGDMGVITSKMDEHIKTAGTVISVAQKNSLYNMCFSLAKYNGKDLTHMDPMTSRLAFIEKIPAPIMDAMVACLSKFDEEISEACKEGEENF